MTPSAQQRVLSMLKGFGTIALLAWVFHIFDLEAFTVAKKDIAFSQVLIVVLCFSLSMAIRTFKWGWLLKRLGFSFVWMRHIRHFVFSVAAGSITPMRLGELIRIAALEKGTFRPGKNNATALSAMGLEKGCELIVLLLIGTAGAFGFFAQTWLGWLFVGATGAALAVIFIPFKLWMKPYRRFPKTIRRKFIAPVLRPFALCASQDKIFVILLSGFCYLLNTTAAWYLYNFFGDMPLIPLFLAYPTITLVSLVPVTIAGIGVRELTAMSLFASLGYPSSSAAIAASLVFFGANLFPAFFLIPLAFTQLIKKRDLVPKANATASSKNV